MRSEKQAMNDLLFCFSGIFLEGRRYGDAEVISRNKQHLGRPGTPRPTS